MSYVLGEIRRNETEVYTAGLMARTDLTKQQSPESIHSMEAYARLARALIQQVSTENVSLTANDLRSYRFSTWCLLALKHGGISMNDLSLAIRLPRTEPRIGRLVTEVAIQRQFIAPLLREMRGERTLAETAQIVGSIAPATWSHWESARRRIPFSMFLAALDTLTPRLHAFCETVNFDQPLSGFGITGNKPKFSEFFFQYPWVPNLYLSLLSEKYRKARRPSSMMLAKALMITPAQVEQGLGVLLDLEMIWFDRDRYRVKPNQVYAPPSLSKEILDQLYQYWFSKSVTLYERGGLHKIEGHALSRESMNKVIGWIGELRERIRKEAAQSEPETVIQIHWQLTDLFQE